MIGHDEPEKASAPAAAPAVTAPSPSTSSSRSGGGPTTRSLQPRPADALPPPAGEQGPGEFAWELTIPPNTLAAGVYTVNFDFGVHNKRRIIDRTGGLMFELTNPAGLGRRFPAEKWNGVLRPAWTWRRVDG